MIKRLVLTAFAGGILFGAAGWLVWPVPPERERTAAELMDVVMWDKEPIDLDSMRRARESRVKQSAYVYQSH